MTELTVRKTGRLRNGRVSSAGACYFVTACVQNRVPVLTSLDQLKRIHSVMHAMAVAEDWRLLAVTVMPDHVHVLFCLGERLMLDRLIAKFKSLSRPTDTAWRWQANVFEHRLRADEESEDYAFYIFMNPYRAGLISSLEVWPGWLRTADWTWRFESGLNADGSPPREWIDRVKEIETRIRIGE